VISKDILKKIKRIEITTRRLVNSVLQGEYLSSFKGRGIEFSDVREYTEGDDVRAIDWNVTARLDAPYVKVFTEEREMQVIFAVDMSGSLSFGTRGQTKAELAAEFASVIGFAAAMNNDRAGFFGFTDLPGGEPERYIPPKKGRRHVLSIIREIIYHKVKGKGTDITAALRYINRLVKRRSVIFVISDFYDRQASGLADAFKALKHRHDVIAVVVRDGADTEIPDCGIIKLHAPETGEDFYLNTSDAGEIKKYSQASKQKDAALFRMLRGLGADFITVQCGKPFMKDLMKFFRARVLRQAR